MLSNSSIRLIFNTPINSDQVPVPLARGLHPSSPMLFSSLLKYYYFILLSHIIKYWFASRFPVNRESINGKAEAGKFYYVINPFYSFSRIFESNCRIMPLPKCHWKFIKLATLISNPLRKEYFEEERQIVWRAFSVAQLNNSEFIKTNLL